MPNLLMAYNDNQNFAKPGIAGNWATFSVKGPSWDPVVTKIENFTCQRSTVMSLMYFTLIRDYSG